MPKPKAPGTYFVLPGDSEPAFTRCGDDRDGSPSQSSLFKPGDDNTVQGEVLLKLTPSSEMGVTASIPTGPLGTRSVGVPSGFGISELDSVLQRYGAQSIVRLHLPSSPATASAEDGVLGATYRVRLKAGSDTGAAIRALSGTAAVAEAGPNRWRQASAIPNDPDFASQWGLTQINCPAAWDRTTGNPGVIVGVVDSGVDLDHPELAALLLPGQDLVDLAGVSPPPGTHFEGDWMVRDDEPQDEVGHGTHVAGTIACATNNALGVAGVTWQCAILPVKITDARGGEQPT